MIFERLQELLGELFTVPEQSITPETGLLDDLGADSLDLVELGMMLEEEFGVTEAEQETMTGLRTVGDLARYLADREG